MNSIEIYTDGSCNAKLKIGSWACIILLEQEIILHSVEEDTTNNRMELTAVLKAFEYVEKNNLSLSKINVYTDSQYVVDLPQRFEKFVKTNFKTKKGKTIRNEDLVYEFKTYISKLKVELVKVKAHQKKTDTKNYNRIVDKLARKLVRERVSLIKC